MIRHTFFLVIAALTIVMSQVAFSLEGKVVGVHDGDTITVLDAQKTQHKIRLAQIDAPEISQAWGKNSKKALSDLVYGKIVYVEVESTDHYGREVGTIFVDDIDVNKKQVATGNAWVYLRYFYDNDLLKLERQARNNRLGLWSSGDATPPWEYRRNK